MVQQPRKEKDCNQASGEEIVEVQKVSWKKYINAVDENAVFIHSSAMEIITKKKDCVFKSLVAMKNQMLDALNYELTEYHYCLNWRKWDAHVKLQCNVVGCRFKIEYEFQLDDQ